MALETEKSRLTEELGKGEGMVSPTLDGGALDINERVVRVPPEAPKWDHPEGQGRFLRPIHCSGPPLLPLLCSLPTIILTPQALQSSHVQYGAPYPPLLPGRHPAVSPRTFSPIPFCSGPFPLTSWLEPS